MLNKVLIKQTNLQIFEVSQWENYIFNIIYDTIISLKIPETVNENHCLHEAMSRSDNPVLFNNTFST